MAKEIRGKKGASLLWHQAHESRLLHCALPPSILYYMDKNTHTFICFLLLFWCPAVFSVSFYNFSVYNTHFVKQFLTLTHNCIMAVINNDRFLTLAMASGYYSSLSIIILISPSVSFICWHSNLFNILLCSQFSRKDFAFAMNNPLFAAHAVKKQAIPCCLFLSSSHSFISPPFLPSQWVPIDGINSRALLSSL